MRKGATGMPMELLIGIILMVVLLLAGLYFSGLIPGFGAAQTAQGYYTSCCTAFTIAQKCNAENIADEADKFDCTVSKEISLDKKSTTMTFSQLASQAGPSPASCCNK